MATPFYNGIFMRLLASLTLVLVLTSANSTETMSMPTTFPTTYGGMEQLASTVLPDVGVHEQQNTVATTLSTEDSTLPASNSSSTTAPMSSSSVFEERIELSTSFPSHTSERLSPFNNAVAFHTICTNSSMDVHLKFSRPFQGFAYSKKNFHNSSCTALARPSSTATEVVLELPFESCGNKMRQVDSGIMVYNTILIQQHQMIITRFDKVLNVSCVVDNSSMVDFRAFEDDDDAIPARPRSRKAVAWLEVTTGSDLYDEESQPPNFIEAALYLVIKVADSQKHRDMVVRNCIAHDRRFITNDTNIYQLYDFYGCPSNLTALEEFTIANQTGQYFDLMGYSRIKNFTLFAQGQLYITCGINLCPDVCNPKCDRPESERYGVFSRVVMKRIVRRAFGATTPSTLNLHADNEPRVKRSVVGDTFSNVYHASRTFLNDLFSNEIPNDEILAPGINEILETKTFTENSNQTESTSASDETTLSTNVEYINGTEALLNVLSTEVLNDPTEIPKRSMVVSLNNTTVFRQKIHTVSSYVSPDSFPSEVFVVAVFVLMVGSYMCLIHSRNQKIQRVASLA